MNKYYLLFAFAWYQAILSGQIPIVETPKVTNWPISPIVVKAFPDYVNLKLAFQTEDHLILCDSYGNVYDKQTSGATSWVKRKEDLHTCHGINRSLYWYEIAHFTFASGPLPNLNITSTVTLYKTLKGISDSTVVSKRVFNYFAPYPDQFQIFAVDSVTIYQSRAANISLNMKTVELSTDKGSTWNTIHLPPDVVVSQIYKRENKYIAKNEYTAFVSDNPQFQMAQKITFPTFPIPSKEHFFWQSDHAILLVDSIIHQSYDFGQAWESDTLSGFVFENVKYSEPYYWIESAGKLFKTSTLKVPFIEIGFGTANSLEVKELSVLDSEQVYVNRYPEGFTVTTDGGATWQDDHDGLPTQGLYKLVQANSKLGGHFWREKAKDQWEYLFDQKGQLRFENFTDFGEAVYTSDHPSDIERIVYKSNDLITFDSCTKISLLGTDPRFNLGSDGPSFGWYRDITCISESCKERIFEIDHTQIQSLPIFIGDTIAYVNAKETGLDSFFVSTNDGTTWSGYQMPNWPSNDFPHLMFFENHFYVFGKGLYCIKSKDFGKTWTQVTKSLNQSLGFYTWYEIKNGIIHAWTNEDVHYLTKDPGIRWYKLTNFNAAQGSTIQFRDAELYFSSYNALFKTSVADLITLLEEQTSAVDGKLVLTQKLIEIAPNPASSFVQVKCYSPGGMESIKVFDSFGSLVLEKDKSTGSQVQLEIAHLNDGLYFLVSSLPNGHNITSKIIKISY